MSHVQLDLLFVRITYLRIFQQQDSFLYEQVGIGNVVIVAGPAALYGSIRDLEVPSVE